MTTRRNFLKTTGIAAAALPLMNEKLFASSLYEKKTGLALYTVRDAMEKNVITSYSIHYTKLYE